MAEYGVNNIPTFEEQAKASWSEILNQYQRRAGLISNLVETVKGLAEQERKVLTDAVDACAKATKSYDERHSFHIHRRTNGGEKKQSTACSKQAGVCSRDISRETWGAPSGQTAAFRRAHADVCS